jgi:hypothetical protein
MPTSLTSNFEYFILLIEQRRTLLLGGRYGVRYKPYPRRIWKWMDVHLFRRHLHTRLSLTIPRTPVWAQMARAATPKTGAGNTSSPMRPPGAFL